MEAGGLWATMKLMKIFQIENDYEKHRKRLISIRSVDAKKKVSTGTLKNVDAINSYKKQKCNSAFFREFEKDRIITVKNEQLHKTLTKVYEKDCSKKILNRLITHENEVHSRTSSQNTARSNASSVLMEKNNRLQKKLSLASSCYKKFRQTPRKHLPTETSHKQEVIKLLEFQLKCKPRVLFPTVRKKPEPDKLHKSWRK